MTQRAARAPAPPAVRRMNALTPSMRRALWWLPEDEQIARFASCDLTRTAPKLSTLDALRLRGLARPVTNTGWWRITAEGLEVRRLATGAFEAERVTT
jgi:hypothetical protein